MGLFDFLKRKSGSRTPEEAAQQQHRYVIDQVVQRLRAKGYHAVKDGKTGSVLVNDDIRIFTGIDRDPGLHPNLLNLLVRIRSERYFPAGGIEESIASLGATFEQQVTAAIDTLFDMLLDTLFRSLTDVHNADDFLLHTGSREVRLHTYLGPICGTGQVDHAFEAHTLYGKLSDPIQAALADRKFNWVKLYIAKMADGTLYYDCIVNNVPLPAAGPALTDLADSLEGRGDLLSARQWIFFRRCDAHEEETRPDFQKALQAVSCFTRDNGSAEEILAALSELFPARNEALQYFYFIPMLFCRIKGGFRSGLFAAKYRLLGSDQQERTFPLAANKIWNVVGQTVQLQLMNTSAAHLDKILGYSGEYRFLKEAAPGDDIFFEGLTCTLDFNRLSEGTFPFRLHDREKADAGAVTELMMNDLMASGHMAASKKELEGRGFSDTFIEFMEAAILHSLAKHPSPAAP